MAQNSKRIWYGDIPRRKCSDCGERIDWDERLRLGYVAKGGPTHQDGMSPMYDPARAYGNTPAGLVEQAKLQAHSEQYHRGGTISTETRGVWTLEIRRYGASLAAGRRMLIARRPFYGMLETATPNGERVTQIIEGCRTPAEVAVLAFGKPVEVAQLIAS